MNRSVYIRGTRQPVWVAEFDLLIEIPDLNKL